MSYIQLINRLDLNFVSLAVLTIIFVMVAGDENRENIRYRLFTGILVVTMIELALEIGIRLLNGQPGLSKPFTVVLIIYFILQPIAPFLWSLYADYHIFFEKKRIAHLALILSLPIIIHTVITVLSPATGWAFSVDGQNVYSRGSLFLYLSALPFLFIGNTFISTLLHWHRLSPRSRFPILFFGFPPMVGGILQSLLNGVSLLWPCVMLSIVMAYLSLENDRLVTDHLTGLQNRRSFDRHLGRKIKHAPENTMFAVVMLDLDGFKLINDRFGHAQGDKALIDTAHILQRCLHANDFIARYAGDEFVVVADIREKDDEILLCSRIKRSFDAFNLEGGKPWTLMASIGASVWDPTESKSAEDLLTEADAQMYREKMSPKIDGLKG